MKELLHIGASKETVLEARKAIIEIMKVSAGLADSEVKVKALETLNTICSVSNVAVTHCIFKGK